jgi:hypothetical protein
MSALCQKQTFQALTAATTTCTLRVSGSLKIKRHLIYRAGRWGPIKSSPVFFESVAVAPKEGKKALAHLLAKTKHVRFGSKADIES